MSKSDQKKTKSTTQRLTETMNTYDGTNYVYDGSDDTINTEAEMKKKFTAQDNYKLLKSVANNQEKKQFRDIERKYKKNSSIDQRTKPFSKKPDTGAAVKIDITALPKINPFENTITHTYGAIEDAAVTEAKPVEQIRSKAELGGLAYLLGVDND